MEQTFLESIMIHKHCWKSPNFCHYSEVPNH